MNALQELVKLYQDVKAWEMAQGVAPEQQRTLFVVRRWISDAIIRQLETGSPAGTRASKEPETDGNRCNEAPPKDGLLDPSRFKGGGW